MILWQHTCKFLLVNTRCVQEFVQLNRINEEEVVPYNQPRRYGRLSCIPSQVSSIDLIGTKSYSSWTIDSFIHSFALYSIVDVDVANCDLSIHSLYDQRIASLHHTVPRQYFQLTGDGTQTRKDWLPSSFIRTANHLTLGLVQLLSTRRKIFHLRSFRQSWLVRRVLRGR